jgi:hypothetical protein
VWATSGIVRDAVARDQDAYNHLLSELQDAYAKLPALRSAAESGDHEEVQKISDDLNASPVNVDARNFGLTQCGKNVQPQG